MVAAREGSREREAYRHWECSLLHLWQRTSLQRALRRRLRWCDRLRRDEVEPPQTSRSPLHPHHQPHRPLRRHALQIRLPLADQVADFLLMPLGRPLADIAGGAAEAGLDETVPGVHQHDLFSRGADTGCRLGRAGRLLTKPADLLARRRLRVPISPSFRSPG